MKKQSPLKLWQIIATVLGVVLLMIVVAGLMFQNAVNLGMIQ